MNKELLVRHGTAFTLNPDSAPMFPSHAHQAAVDRLIAGLRLGSRLQYLSGAPGSGKSTVLLHFLKTMQSLRGVYIALVSAGDMVRRVLMELDLVVPRNLDRSPDALFRELRVQMAAKSNPILLIDKVENLPIADLKSLNLLSDKLSLPVILAGNCDFARVAQDFDTDKSFVSGRIHRLDALDGEETAQYIRSRLEYSGLDEPFIPEDVLQRIYRYSKGNPRLINLICNKALILVGLRDLPRVTSEVVDEVVRNRRAGGTFPLAGDIEVDGGRIAAAEDSHDRGNFRPSCSGPVIPGVLPAGADDTASEAPQVRAGTGNDPNAGRVVPTKSTAVSGSTGHWRPGWLGFGLATCVTVIVLLNSPDLDRPRSLGGESTQTVAQPGETGWNGAAVALALVQQETLNDAMVFDARGIGTVVLTEPPEAKGAAAPAVTTDPAAGESRQAEPAATRKRIQEDTDRPQSPTTETPAVSEGLSKHRQPHASAHQHREEAGEATGSRPDTASGGASRKSHGSDVAGSRDEAYAASESGGVSPKPQGPDATDSRAEVSATAGTGMPDDGEDLPPVIERGIQARPTDVPPRLSSN
ncbi:AAA family ATPase [Thiohalobacter thiocyanaticus]|uniref:ORC1/DEAH AAA+ ATPase domain-containing protein n=1 Tax=Thiohalobacter thiocyanaticus TaxID=585455 RepID=A0A426QGM5_9GAMM|nr:AAA family ATPase [Thiohalobacter thiocyanaticus]RRQ20908.1 hypothetical protein D6C00_02280 [Thiohalobacter thiocyanaticus]